MQEILETSIRSLGQEDPLEEGMATHSRVLPWRIPWTEEPNGLESKGSQRVRHDRSDLAHTHFYFTNENLESCSFPNVQGAIRYQKKTSLASQLQQIQSFPCLLIPNYSLCLTLLSVKDSSHPFFKPSLIFFFSLPCTSVLLPSSHIHIMYQKSSKLEGILVIT